MHILFKYGRCIQQKWPLISNEGRLQWCKQECTQDIYKRQILTYFPCLRGVYSKEDKKNTQDFGCYTLDLHEILQIVLRGYYEHSVFPFYSFPVPGTRKVLD